MAEELSISEEIEEDDFADSSDKDNDGGGSTEEQVTKDETVSTEVSMAVDYKEKF